MKPTLEQIEQWQDHVDGGKDDRLFTHTQDWLTEFAELAHQAGMEKGKADYEREHLRHTVPLPDALRVMQDQVAEACIGVIEAYRIPVGNSLDEEIACQSTYKALSIIREELRAGEWRAHFATHTASQIDRDKAVAEACADTCKHIWENRGRHKEAIDCEQAIRQGDWRKYMEGKS